MLSIKLYIALGALTLILPILLYLLYPGTGKQELMNAYNNAGDRLLQRSSAQTISSSGSSGSVGVLGNVSNSFDNYIGNSEEYKDFMESTNPQGETPNQELTGERTIYLPIKGTDIQVSSNFSYDTERGHSALDVISNNGGSLSQRQQVAVYSPVAGTIWSNYNKDKLYGVIIDTGTGEYHWICHFVEPSPLAVGTVVSVGDYLGNQGNSGIDSSSHSGAAHVHWEIAFGVGGTWIESRSNNRLYPLSNAVFGQICAHDASPATAKAAGQQWAVYFQQPANMRNPFTVDSNEISLAGGTQNSHSYITYTDSSGAKSSTYDYSHLSTGVAGCPICSKPTFRAYDSERGVFLDEISN